MNLFLVMLISETYNEGNHNPYQQKHTNYYRKIANNNEKTK
jgi:hypothetical protein